MQLAAAPAPHASQADSSRRVEQQLAQLQSAVRELRSDNAALKQQVQGLAAALEHVQVAAVQPAARLPTPTDSRSHAAAVKLQARYRGRSIRLSGDE